MRRIAFFLTIGMVFLVASRAEGASPDPQLPKFGGKPTLATVNGEPLTLEEFDKEISDLHSGVSDNASAARLNPSEMLERMINVMLIVQEAKNIGLDALPEAVAAVKIYREDTLRGMLYGYQARNVKTDKKEIEKRYKAAVKEVKVASILIENEDRARQFEAEVRASGDFDGSAKRMLDLGEAKGSLVGKYLKSGSLSPEVAAAVASMKKGETSSLLKVGKQFSMLKLEDVRFPEDPAAREKIEDEVLQEKTVAVLKKYMEGLRKKYAKVNEKLLKSLDYDSAESGFENLLADQRVLVKIKGDSPLTVTDLSLALKRKFYHGADQAAKKKRINNRKGEVLDELLVKRLSLKEAIRKKLDRTQFFTRQVEEYRKRTLFGTFVQKAIDPDVKVEDGEIKAYLESHIGEYTTPEMMRIDGLAFGTKEDAVDVVEKLRKGADFQWMKSNAEGQVAPDGRRNLLEFGETLVVMELPEGIQKAVSGAASGDYRLYSEPLGPSYVLRIGEVFPAKPKPYESVRDSIHKKLFAEKRLKSLHAWEEQLRKASTIEIFASGERLERIVRPDTR